MPNNTRDETFVPLTPLTSPGNSRADYRVTVLSDAEKAQPFRPLGLSPTPASAAPVGNSEPRVAVQRDGDRVSSIQVQCGCGRVIDLACVYDAPKPA